MENYLSMHVKEVEKRFFKYKKMFWCNIFMYSHQGMYIDFASDLSTDSFLLTFLRFTSPRGKPPLIKSSRNFVRLEHEIREPLNKLNQQKMTSKFNEIEMEGRFNTPLAPWIAIESIVSLTERSIKVTVNDYVIKPGGS